LGSAALLILGLASWSFRAHSPKGEPDIEALASNDPEVRVNAIQRIADAPLGKEALSAITTSLSDSDSRVRRGALTAIARIDPRISLIPLLQALSDPDESIRQLASESLATLDASPTTDVAWRQAFASTTQSVRVRAVEHIEIGATPENLVKRLVMA